MVQVQVGVQAVRSARHGGCFSGVRGGKRREGESRGVKRGYLEVLSRRWWRSEDKLDKAQPLQNVGADKRLFHVVSTPVRFPTHAINVFTSLHSHLTPQDGLASPASIR